MQLYQYQLTFFKGEVSELVEEEELVEKEQLVEEEELMEEERLVDLFKSKSTELVEEEKEVFESKVNIYTKKCKCYRSL